MHLVHLSMCGVDVRSQVAGVGPEWGESATGGQLGVCGVGGVVERETSDDESTDE